MCRHRASFCDLDENGTNEEFLDFLSETQGMPEEGVGCLKKGPGLWEFRDEQDQLSIRGLKKRESIMEDLALECLWGRNNWGEERQDFVEDKVATERGEMCSKGSRTESHLIQLGMEI